MYNIDTILSEKKLSYLYEALSQEEQTSFKDLVAQRQEVIKDLTIILRQSFGNSKNMPKFISDVNDVINDYQQKFFKYANKEGEENDATAMTYMAAVEKIQTEVFDDLYDMFNSVATGLSEWITDPTNKALIDMAKQKHQIFGPNPTLEDIFSASISKGGMKDFFDRFNRSDSINLLKAKMEQYVPENISVTIEDAKTGTLGKAWNTISGLFKSKNVKISRKQIIDDIIKLKVYDLNDLVTNFAKEKSVSQKQSELKKKQSQEKMTSPESKPSAEGTSQDGSEGDPIVLDKQKAKKSGKKISLPIAGQKLSLAKAFAQSDDRILKAINKDPQTRMSLAKALNAIMGKEIFTENKGNK